jgi:DNA polymerase III epsilon subunit-like protein
LHRSCLESEGIESVQIELCDLAVVDVETSGWHPKHGAEIIELAAMRFDPRTMLPRVGCVDLLVKPKRPVPSDAYCRTKGYNEAEWEEKGVTIEEALTQLFPMIVGAKWTGQNPSFDRDFCTDATEASEMAWPKLGDYHMLDVGSLAYPLVLEGTIPSESQRYLQELFGLGTQSHRAMPDVRNSASILSRLLNAARLGYRTAGITALGPVPPTPKK